MSQENVDLVRGVIEAHKRGDSAAVFAAYDPEIEWNVGRLERAPGFEPVYHGHEGVRAFWRVWYGAWETVSFEYEEFTDVGADVLAILSQRMRGRTSGVELEWSSYAQVWTVKDGKIARVEFFHTRAEALEALGLRA